MTYLISLVFAGVLAVGGGNNFDLLVANHQISEKNTATVAFDERERFEQTYPFNANGKISVSNVNGSINIEAWDKNEIKLEWVKTADDKDRLDEVQIKINARQDSFSIETDYGSWKNSNNRNWNRNGNNLSVTYRLMVPKGAYLDEIETVNGSVNVSNMTNVTKISAVNGQVKAINLRGTAELSTVNGTTEADFESLQSGSKISLSTVNGTVKLVLPSDANATIKADTVNGRIENDFGLPVHKGKYVGRNLYGRVGNGDAQIKLDSVNGGLSIKHRNDGKAQSPATNLLPPKSKDGDHEWDEEDNVSNTVSNSTNTRAVRNMTIDAQRIAKEAIAISADAMKQVAIEMKQAEIEMQQAEREVSKAEREMQKDIMRYETSEESNSITKTADAFNVKGTPKVTIEAQNSSVQVRSWDKQEIAYSITRISNSRKTTEKDFNINHTDEQLTIISTRKENNHSDDNYNSNRVRIEVFVPRKTNLKISSNEAIRVNGISGEFDITGVDESINVSDSVGKLRVSNVDGKVRVIGFKGEVEAKTVDGNVNLEGGFEKISGKSVDGTFIVSIANSAGADVQSNTEEITVEDLEVSKKSEGRWQIGKGGSRFDFNVTDGKVVIRNNSQLKSN